MTARRSVAALCLSSVLLLAAACKEEGPAERMGEKIDDASQDVREGFDDARDKLREEPHEHHPD